MTNKPNWSNRTIFQGDNLKFLEAMHTDSVDLIATDPPFNKNREFIGTPGSKAEDADFNDKWLWEDATHLKWIKKLHKNYPDLHQAIITARGLYGNDMGAFLCFMSARLLEMQRILKPSGSIYLHCDPTASHYLKAIMDGIFGPQNFRSEIIWKRTSSHNRAKRWGPVHDVILYYAGNGYTWNRVLGSLDETYVQGFYRFADDKGRYRLGDLTGPGLREGDTGQPWRGIDPSKKRRHWEPPPDRALPDWFVFPNGYAQMPARKRLDVLDEQGMIYWPKKKNGVPQFKRYLTSNSGTPASDMITDIPPVPAKPRQKTGWPTEKPIRLYERIIEASSNPGDVVLDPFCGCATTCVAAERLGRQWVGIDKSRIAHKIVVERLEDETEQGNLFVTLSDVHHETRKPERTDDGEKAQPYRLRPPKRGIVLKAWQKLTPDQMRKELLQAQSTSVGLIACGGCGRKVEAPFVELDHKTPKSDDGPDWITNRILLCIPCNRTKSNRLTMSGLVSENGKSGWTKSKAHKETATQARDAAADRAREIEGASPAEINRLLQAQANDGRLI